MVGLRLLSAGLAAGACVLAAAVPGPGSACPVSGAASPPAAEVALAPGVAHSRVCAQCHSFAETASGLRNAAGENIAPFDLWLGTMMANAARDPLWQAVMSAEVAAMPHQRDRIEAECLNCHAPMAARVGLAKHEADSYTHLLSCDSELGQIAQDGVSCTICHGIAPENLGTEESFSAGFVLNEDRRLFGPFEKPLEPPMRARSGFTPTHSSHIQDAALCGSCHTLLTPVFDAEGRETEQHFLEQAPYLEWRNSAFQDEQAPGPAARSCQACHMGRTNPDGSPIATRLARNPAGRDFPPTRPRAPFARHDIVGGNTLVLGIFRDHAEALGATAPPAAFAATLQATRQLLETESAQLRLLPEEATAGQLRFTVELKNRTGHKLPTAHPTRRAWLHLRVTDARGVLVFENGGVDEAGRILGPGGTPLPSENAGGPLEPHRTRITRADTPLIYQAVMADLDGRPTHRLLRGARWAKDNRLLPQGWSATHRDAARTAPVGTEDDADFAAGTDRVPVIVTLPPEARGPFQIEARLLFQTLSARWAAELFTVKTPAIARFRELYASAQRGPEVLATTQLTL